MLALGLENSDANSLAYKDQTNTRQGIMARFLRGSKIVWLHARVHCWGSSNAGLANED